MNRAILAYVAASAFLSFRAGAQTPPETYQQPYQQPQQSPQGPRLSPQELGNLVAPIALYPDLLLSEVLAASTYPLELTQAQQWMQANPGLRGQQLVESAKQQNWDPSVQALVAFPDVMNLLTRDIQWTTDLGNAFLAQQTDVMDAIQRLRASARNNGRLTDTPQQRVTYEQQDGQNAIVIQPTDPQVVYPPVYNPEYVWGPPVYGVYPPLGYPPGYGISYAVGTFLGALFTGLLSFGGWGWGLSWLTHGLFLNGLFFSHFGFHGYNGYGFHPGSGYARAAWVHDPGHRLGVPYGSHFAGSHFAGAQHYANYAGRSYTQGRSSYQGSSRQMEAYRGLTANAARRGYSGYGSGFRGGYSGGYSQPRSSGGNFSSHYSASYSGSSHYSAPKAARQSNGRDGHFNGGGGHSGGGGGRSGGHGHSGGGGGGHSHGGGSHRK